MVVPDDARRAGGNGGVTLQSRYRSGTVSKGFEKRLATRDGRQPSRWQIKLLPGAHSLQVGSRLLGGAY
jgi:hypothetical protein